MKCMVMSSKLILPMFKMKLLIKIIWLRRIWMVLKKKYLKKESNPVSRVSRLLKLMEIQTVDTVGLWCHEISEKNISNISKHFSYLLNFDARMSKQGR